MVGAGSKAFPHMETMAFYCALALLMIFARGLGELARKFKQPVVLGEILAGLVIGKTILGRVWPQAWTFMFGPGLQLTAISAVSSLASTLFMLVAGLEMDLDRTLAQKHKPLIIGTCSVIFPFAWGFGVTYANPKAMGAMEDADHVTYAFFAGTAMSITAMPVVAKTLRDVGLYRAQIGQAVMSSATVDDLVGWSLFAVVLSLSNPSENLLPGVGTGGVIALSVVYVIFMVAFGKYAFPRFFLWIQATFSFPGGILGFVIAWTYLSACIGKLLGLHNTLGAFLVGASLSNNKYLRSTTREIIDEFVTYCIAPVFFGFIAVGADFIGDFDVALVVLVLTIACIGKFMGASLGARVTGSTWRESFALATCMNSRGAMEILLANVALSAGVIDGRMFVALVFMAIFTSLLPGPILRRILRRKERKVFTAYMPNPHGFVQTLASTDMERVIKEMCAVLNQPEAAERLIQQEHNLPSGNHNQMAISYMNVDTIRRPKIAVGLSASGVDFSGHLGYPGDHPHVANIVIVILFPPKRGNADMTLEDDLIQQISLVFGRQAFRNEFLRATKYLEVLHLINMETHRLGLLSTQEEGLNDMPPALNVPLAAAGDLPDTVGAATTSDNDQVNDAKAEEFAKPGDDLEAQPAQGLPSFVLSGSPRPQQLAISPRLQQSASPGRASNSSGSGESHPLSRQESNNRQVSNV